jgi:hypothetical protein
MDDFAIPLLAATSMGLLAAIADAGIALKAAAADFGLRVNFDAGKTECLFALAGSQQQLARDWIIQHPPVADSSGAVALLPLDKIDALRLVTEDKHVGIMATAGRTLLREVGSRCNSGNAASAALSRHVFAKRQLPIEVRAMVAQACVESRVLHAAGTWGPLTIGLRRRVDVALTRPLRRIARAGVPDEDGQFHQSNLDVRARFDVPLTDAKIDAARLRYAARAATHAPDFLHALIQGPGGEPWRQEVIYAMLIMRLVLAPRLHELPMPDSHPHIWERWMCKWPTAWAALIRHFLAVVAELPQKYLSAVASVRGPIFFCAGEDDGEWVCLRCACAPVFCTRRGLKIHAIRCHDSRIEVRWFAIGSVCPVCQTDFRSRLRLLAHLQWGAKACVHAASSGRLPRFSLEQVAAADAFDAAHHTFCVSVGRSCLAGSPAIRPSAS